MFLKFTVSQNYRKRTRIFPIKNNVMSKDILDSKFKRIVQETFYSKLKPLGFKKKGNNFYKKIDRFGHFVNFQRSINNSYLESRFTINICIFSDDFYSGYFAKEIPDIPGEPECVVRFRIGQFIDGKDKWYVINDNTNVDIIILELNTLIDEKIIPWFSERENFESIKLMINNQEGSWMKYSNVIFNFQIHEYMDALTQLDKILEDLSLNENFRRKMLKVREEIISKI
jgi:hypothetical protein